MEKPTRDQTHKALDFGRMMTLLAEVEDGMNDKGIESLTPEAVQELADDLGTRESYIYVAAATVGEVPVESPGEIRFEVCVGDCQRWGALPALDRLITLQAKRRVEGRPPISIIPKDCLHHCEHAPAITVQTPDGNAVMKIATPESVDEAMTEIEAG